MLTEVGTLFTREILVIETAAKWSRMFEVSHHPTKFVPLIEQIIEYRINFPKKIKKPREELTGLQT